MKNLVLKTLIVAGDSWHGLPPTYGAKPVQDVRTASLPLRPDLGLVTQALVDCVGGTAWINVDRHDLLTCEQARLQGLVPLMTRKQALSLNDLATPFDVSEWRDQVLGKG